MLLEVIVQNAKEAVEAEKLGAGRLELVSAINEGGLTPSYGTIKRVLESVSIPVQVMIRPHSQNFFYDESELETILEDVRNVLNLGCYGIVFGSLNKDSTVDEKTLEKIIQLSDNLDITFHRAFDEIDQQLRAYRVLNNYNNQVKRILTSGGSDNCLEGIEDLKNLVQFSRELEGPSILCGGGLNPENIKEIHQVVSSNEYHFGRGVRKNQSFAHGFKKEAFERIMELRRNEHENSI